MILFVIIAPDIRYDRNKYLVISKRTLRKCCRRLRFCYKQQHRCFIVNFKTVFRHFGQSLIKENYHNSRTSDDIAQLWISNDSKFMKIFQKFKISIILELIQTERKILGGEEFPE